MMKDIENLYHLCLLDIGTNTSTAINGLHSILQAPSTKPGGAHEKWGLDAALRLFTLALSGTNPCDVRRYFKLV